MILEGRADPDITVGFYLILAAAAMLFLFFMSTPFILLIYLGYNYWGDISASISNILEQVTNLFSNFGIWF